MKPDLQKFDAEPLRPWIQPRHLERGALLQYQQTFQSHPAQYVYIRNFLTADIAEKLSKFLAIEAIYRPDFGLYSHHEAVTQEQFDGAAEADRFFRMRKLKATDPQFMMSPNALTYVRFRRLFQQAELKSFYEMISGLPLGASDDFGSHLMVEGDFLRRHSDNNRNRRLALVIYLSPEWDRRFGGELQIFTPEGVAAEIAPEYNSMIAFDVRADTEHAVNPILQGRRLSIGGWYPQGQPAGAK